MLSNKWLLRIVISLIILITEHLRDRVDEMKYIVVLGDGMADYPVKELSGKTPLQAAHKPNMDLLASRGEIGLVKTIPDSLPPGSDVANLAVLGYDPAIYYTGRSPLEAASIGIQMNDTDIAFRTNLVTLSDAGEYSQRIMLDHSSDEITTAEAGQLIDAINDCFSNDFLTFYKGVSYRHCLIWKDGSLDLDLTPPHDILGEGIGAYLPKGRDAGIILDMMQGSVSILENHPVNQSRVKRGLKPANSIWIWGQGKKPALPSFKEKYGLDGAVISAVDLIKGLGLSAGLDTIDVEGATGNIHTNYKGKARAALEALKRGKDFVFIHIEAPDECGHRYEIDNKVRSIELIDELVVGTLVDSLEEYGDYRLLILPDHPTPLSLRTHTRDPVPYIFYRKSRARQGIARSYDEYTALNGEGFFETGPDLMAYFLK